MTTGNLCHAAGTQRGDLVAARTGLTDQLPALPGVHRPG